MWSQEQSPWDSTILLRVMQLVGDGHTLQVWHVGDRSDWEALVDEAVVNEHVADAK